MIFFSSAEVLGDYAGMMNEGVMETHRTRNVPDERLRDHEVGRRTDVPELCGHVRHGNHPGQAG